MSRLVRVVVVATVLAVAALLLAPTVGHPEPNARAATPEPSTTLGDAVPAPRAGTGEPTDASTAPSDAATAPGTLPDSAADSDGAASGTGSDTDTDAGAADGASGTEDGLLPGLPSLPGLPQLPTLRVADCTNPPEIGGPQAGPAGQLDPGSDAPRTGDPFAPGAEVSMYEVYGWGGFTWVDYDLGCGPDAVRAPGRSNLGNAARLLLLGLTVATAATTAVLRLAFDENTLGVLDPVLRFGVEVVGNSVWVTLGWLTLAVTGVLILTSAREGLVARQARSAGAALSITVLVVLVLSYPLAGMGVLDRSVVGAVTAVNNAAADAGGQPGGDLADTVGADLHAGIVYSTWLAGNFGRYGGETAERYGPLLYDASTLTRAEAQVLAEDPVAGAEIVADKERQYRAVADQIRAEDPEAYSYLEGNNNEARIAYALLGWLAWASAALFVLLAALVLLYALVIARLLIVAVPLIAVVAVLPGRRHHLTRPLMYGVGVLWHGLRFGVVGAVYTMILGFLLGPEVNLPFVLLLLILGVVTAGAWRIANPWQALRAITGGWRLQRESLPALPTSDRNDPPVHRRDDVFDGSGASVSGEPAESEATRSIRARAGGRGAEDAAAPDDGAAGSRAGPVPSARVPANGRATPTGEPAEAVRTAGVGVARRGSSSRAAPAATVPGLYRPRPSGPGVGAGASVLAGRPTPPRRSPRVTHPAGNRGPAGHRSGNGGPAGRDGADGRGAGS